MSKPSRGDTSRTLCTPFRVLALKGFLFYKKDLEQCLEEVFGSDAK